MAFVKWLVKFIAYLMGLVLLIILFAYTTGYGYLLKGVRLTYLSGYKSANINDATGFDTRLIDHGDVISNLPHSTDFNIRQLPIELKEMLEGTKTAAFLVVKNDSLAFEEYYLGHTDTDRMNSFSMAKTITTMLVQKAIEDGLIASWDEKVTKYLPWLKGAYANELTLKHLSTMTAGLDWEESYYDPFGITARAYYGTDVEATMHKVSVVFKPGDAYDTKAGQHNY